MEKKVIIRAETAGVFYGELTSRVGSEVEMSNVRRLWFWSGANSLSQLAVNGVRFPLNCKFSVIVSSMTILGVIEIIPCTPKAIESIESVPVWSI